MIEMASVGKIRDLLINIKDIIHGLLPLNLNGVQDMSLARTSGLYSLSTLCKLRIRF